MVKSNKAFTLVELLVAITIIGLLSTIVFVSLSGVRDKARITKGLYFAKQLETNLGADLIGRWSFDEGSGNTAYDSSGYGNDGAISGASWKCVADDLDNTPSGKGCSLSFDGVDDYIATGITTQNSYFHNGFTISAWIYPRGWGGGGYGRIVDKSTLNEGDNGFYIALNSNTGGLLTLINKSNAISSFNNSISLNKWQHVVLVVKPVDANKSSLTFYIDGVQSGNLDQSVNKGLSGIATNNPLAIGNLSISTTRTFDGLIDEVLIFSTPLSLSQIQSQYYSGLNNLLAKGLMAEEEYQERLENN